MWKQVRLAGIVLAIATTALFGTACGTEQPTPTPAPQSQPTPTQTGAPTPTQAAATPTPAFDAEAHFRGKTVTILVGFAPGGGYDIVSRLFAQYAPRHFPGSPRFIVQNLPGSGSERGLRAAMAAPPDGLTVHPMIPRFVQTTLMGVEVPGFELDRVGIIGSPTVSHRVTPVSVRSAVAQSWDEVLGLGREITNGEVQAGGPTDLGPRMLSLLGYPVRMVYGYGGSSEVLAAFERGELDATAYANYTIVPRLYPEWLDNKYFAPVLSWGVEPDRDPGWQEMLQVLGVPEPPRLLDAVDATEGQKLMFELTYNINADMSRTFILPSDTPPHILDTWRRAFRDTVNDPTFVQAADASGYEINYGDPEFIDGVLAQATEAVRDPELAQFFARLAGVVD